MTDLCQRWVELLANLLVSPNDPEVLRLDPEERRLLGRHVIECDACERNPGLDALDHAPEEVVEKVPGILIAFLGQLADDEPPEDMQMREKLHQAVEDSRTNVRARVQELIAMHPALRPEALQLPADIDPLELFTVGECLRMTYVAYPPRGQPLEALMGRWGQLYDLSGKALIPVSSIEGEVARTIEADKAKRLLIGNMVQWVFVALQHEPLLFRGLRAESVTLDRKRYLKLTKRPKDAPQHGWEGV